MTPTKITKSLISYLVNPLRCWNKTPAISEDKNTANNNAEGIIVDFSGIEYQQNDRSQDYKDFIFDLVFYTSNITGKPEPLLEYQRYINLFFNKQRNNRFDVCQLIQIKSKNNNWEVTNVSNELDTGDNYGSNNDPELTENITYTGYRVRNTHGDHFLYKKPNTLRVKGGWKILDLSTHLTFPVSRFRGNYAEVVHGNDTYFYEFVRTRVFNGSQFINIISAASDFVLEEGDNEIASLISSDITLQIRDYDNDECPPEQEIFESVLNPSHNYNPTIYNKKFLIATTSPDPIFSTAEWRSGVKIEDSLSITFRPTTTNRYRGIALSSDKITGISQDGNPFGNVISAYDYNGIIDVDNIKYYSYRTKYPYFPISETHQYTVVEDEDRDAFLISYLSGDTGESHSVDDFTFSNAEVEVDPNRQYHEFAIEADQPSYICILFSGGNINRIMDGTINLRNTAFTPAIDQPFIQTVVRGRIFNAFVSNRTFFTIASWRLYYS